MLDIVSRLVFFVACSHQKQLQRLIKKHPELLKKDTIFVHDTIITKEINTDTIFYPKHFTDTFYLDREKLKIQIIRQRDTIRVHAKVQPDTVFVEKKIPIDRIQVKYDYFNPLLNKLLIFSFLLLLFLILLHDKRKNKWADPLTQAMILLILGLILFFIFKKMTAAFSMFALSAIRGFYMLKHEKGLIIENDYPGIFYVKPENSDEPIKVTPHTSLPIPADGIKIKDKVFKLRTGTNVKITKEGQVITYSPISALVNGYVQLKDFNKQERESWKKLFKISN